MQKSRGFGRVRCLDGARQRAFLGAEFAARLIAVQQCLPDTGVSQHFMPQVAGNAFCAIAPEHDLFLQIDHAYARRQTLQNVAADFRFAQGRHMTTWRSPHSYSSSAQLPPNFTRPEFWRTPLNSCETVSIPCG